MKASILVFSMLFFLSLLAAPVRADSPPWTGDGTYTFDATDPYFTHNYITDSATVNILGGSFGILSCHENSRSYVFDSSDIGGFKLYDNSRLVLYGGAIRSIKAADNSCITLFAENWILNPVQGFDGLLTGNWLNQGEDFSILILEESLDHINVIPEPCTLSLICLGSSALLRRFRSG